jgi:hypothetical protein
MSSSPNSSSSAISWASIVLATSVAGWEAEQKGKRSQSQLIDADNHRVRPESRGGALERPRSARRCRSRGSNTSGGPYHSAWVLSEILGVSLDRGPKTLVRGPPFAQDCYHDGFCELASRQFSSTGSDLRDLPDEYERLQMSGDRSWLRWRQALRFRTTRAPDTGSW